MTPADPWHADPTLLRRYAAGQLDPTAAWSVEQHVTACAECRAAVAEVALVPAPRLDAIWADVEATVDAPTPRPVERMLLLAGVPDHTARLLAATPALTVPWLVAVGIVLAVTAAVARLDVAGPLLFLTIAPLVPAAGVAVAFGRWSDPAHEIALAAPVRSGRLLLVRAAAVTGTSFALAAAAAPLLPGIGWMAAAWVLPGLAVTASALALSTWWSPAVAATAVGGGWLAVVLVAEAATSTALASFGDTGQALWACLGAVATGVVLARREAFDGGRTA